MYCDKTLALVVPPTTNSSYWFQIKINGSTYGTTPILITNTDQILAFINSLGFGIATLETSGSNTLLQWKCNKNEFTENRYYTDITFVTVIAVATTTETECQETPCGCTECYEITLEACLDSYVLNWNLIGDPDNELRYTLLFKDLHGIKYEYSIMPDIYGSFELFTTEFPEGFFTPEYGITTVTVLDTNGEVTFFEFNGIKYECIILSFEYITDVTVE